MTPTLCVGMLYALEQGIYRNLHENALPVGSTLFFGEYPAQASNIKRDGGEHPCSGGEDIKDVSRFQPAWSGHMGTCDPLRGVVGYMGIPLRADSVPAREQGW